MINKSKTLDINAFDVVYNFVYCFTYNKNSNIFNIIRTDSRSVKSLYAQTQRELFDIYGSLLCDYNNGIVDEFYCPMSTLRNDAQVFGLTLDIYATILTNSIVYYEEHYPEKFI